MDLNIIYYKFFLKPILVTDWGISN